MPRINLLARYFGSLINIRTYFNIIYLILSFPLGVLYFTIFITLISTGVSTLFLCVGFLLIALVIAGWYGFLQLERFQSRHLLRIDPGPLYDIESLPVTFIKRVVHFCISGKAWKGFLFLLLKFPLGIISFVITILGISISSAMLTAPFMFRIVPLQIHLFTEKPPFVIDTFMEAYTFAFIGLLIMPAMLHGINMLGKVWEWLSTKLIGHQPSELHDHAPKDVPVPSPTLPGDSAA
jgi:hypothetical protein